MPLETALRTRRAAPAAPTVTFHGCDESVAEILLRSGSWTADKSWWTPSSKDFEWLGMGMYFWLDSPMRAFEWAKTAQQRSKKANSKPSLVGAVINPGLCLNLMDYGVIEELRQAYDYLTEIRKSAGSPMSANTRLDPQGSPLLRRLDCEVIQTVHQLRADNAQQPYDTVMGFFEEGEMAFDGSSIRAKTHVQIAVRNPEAIVGFFRVI